MDCGSDGEGAAASSGYIRSERRWPTFLVFAQRDKPKTGKQGARGSNPKRSRNAESTCQVTASEGAERQHTPRRKLHRRIDTAEDPRRSQRLLNGCFIHDIDHPS